MTESLGSILVVDDNEMNRDMLSRRLIRYGYEVTVAAGGAEGIDQLESRSFDTILLDIMMPEISGWDLLKWIRERHSIYELPVIMATAKDSTEDIVQALELGANDYVIKPLNMKVVLARVSTQVNLKRTTESLKTANDDLKSSNERLNRDLKSAATVQQSELPPKSPQLQGCDVSWAYVPCDDLGGDFLDVFNLDENHIGLYLLDVSGHGVSAALMSVAVSRAMKPSQHGTCVVSRPDRSDSDQTIKITSPAIVADTLNERFPANIGTGQYFTFVYGILNTQTRVLRFCSAGHLSPAIIRANGSVELAETESGFPIGLIQGSDTGYKTCPEMEIALNPGDRIIFYSDGVTEAMNSKEELFEDPNLLKTLADNAQLPLDQCVTSLLQGVLDWSAPQAPDDDVSILALEVQ